MRVNVQDELRVAADWRRVREWQPACGSATEVFTRAIHAAMHVLEHLQVAASILAAMQVELAGQRSRMNRWGRGGGMGAAWLRRQVLHTTWQ